MTWAWELVSRRYVEAWDTPGHGLLVALVSRVDRRAWVALNNLRGLRMVER